MLFENLINNWWTILQKIKNINITIRTYYLFDSTKYNSNYREILLDKNNQLNRYFKVEWIDAEDKYKDPYIEINIIRQYSVFQNFKLSYST